MARSKRYKKAIETIDVTKRYSVENAIAALKKFAPAKFDEAIELNVQLGIDTKQVDQTIRGTASLPHGSGKKIRVICFVKGEAAKDAEKAGADEVGAEELAKKVQGGWLDFDSVVAHPDMMRDISKLGRVLGPKGLMPSPKAGTVTPNVGKAVEDLKKGKIELKNDKTGGLHAICGKVSFAENALVENVNTVIHALNSLKPQSVKGDYMKSVTLSSTMGPGLRLETAALAGK